MPDASPETPTPDLPPVPAPASEEPPKMPPPSPTVEPFISGGGPPTPEKTKPPHSPKGLVTLLAIIVLLAIAGSTLALYGPSVGVKVGLIKGTPTPTAAPSVGLVTSDLTEPLQSLDTSIGDLETNLSDSDTVLSDKQGDLSE